jgi:hypothetical protein
VTELELGEGFYLLPRGMLPSVVVCLEMTERPAPREAKAPARVPARANQRRGMQSPFASRATTDRSAFSWWTTTRTAAC